MCVRVAHSVSHRLVMSHGGAGVAVSHPDPGGPAWVLTDVRLADRFLRPVIEWYSSLGSPVHAANTLSRRNTADARRASGRAAFEATFLAAEKAGLFDSLPSSPPSIQRPPAAALPPSQPECI